MQVKHSSASVARKHSSFSSWIIATYRAEFSQRCSAWVPQVDCFAGLPFGKLFLLFNTLPLLTTSHCDLHSIRLPCVQSLRYIIFPTCVHTHVNKYIMTSVLLCINMHRESGSDSEVDPIVKLIWSKVCITISITISITKLATIVA